MFHPSERAELALAPTSSSVKTISLAKMAKAVIPERAPAAPIATFKQSLRRGAGSGGQPAP
eukprot:1120106-Pyramimonas_sp.AAC.1